MPRKSTDATPYDSLVSDLRKLYEHHLTSAKAVERPLREAEENQKNYIREQSSKIDSPPEAIAEIAGLLLESGPTPVETIAEALPHFDSRTIRNTLRAYASVGRAPKAPKKYPEYALEFVKRGENGELVVIDLPPTSADRESAYPPGVLVALRSQL